MKFYSERKVYLFLLFFAGVILFNVYIFPSIEEKFDTGKILIPPDLHFFYDKNFVCHFLKELKETGRSGYALTMRFDMIYPVIYSVSFYLLMQISAKPNARKFPTKLYAVPFLAALFDWAENLSMMYALHVYPDCAGSITAIAPFFTMFKWMAVGTSFLIILYLLILRFKPSGGKS